MQRKGLLLAAVLTLALWLGVGTAAAGGGLPLLGGGGGQDNSAIVVQNVASGNTIQGIGNEAGSNGAVAVANVDQTNVARTDGQDSAKPESCGCDQSGGPQGSDQSRPADQSNSAIVVQNVASGNTIQGIGNEAGSNGAVAAANVDQTNVDTTNGRDPGKPSGCLCNQVDGPQGPPDQSQPADQQNDAVVVQNVASGNTVQGAFNDQGRDGNQDGCGCDGKSKDGGQNGAIAVANVDQTNVDRQSGDEHRCGSCGGSDSSNGSSADQSNHAIVVQNVASGNTIQGAFNHAGSNGAVAVAGVDQKNVASSQGGDSKWSKNGKDGGNGVDQSNHALVVQNVASGNTIQLIGNKAGSNGAVAVAGVDQTNVASSQGEGDSKWSKSGKDGGNGVDQSNHALVVQNVLSGNTVQGAFNKAGSNGAVAVADVQQKNVSSEGGSYRQNDKRRYENDGKDSYGKNGNEGCGSCKPEPKPCPPPEPKPCPPPKPEPCPPPKPEPCPPKPCPPKPCPPKPCPGLPGPPGVPGAPGVPGGLGLVYGLL